ncbi:polysaccharide deacetylase family protein [Pontibacter silvestris]|uniref:Polysaccharide deacetylase family protein n=1 Tax=Pontibacter silvestris TaxID=2305183 RepID=A0ABW4X3H5_9BACT|nr:polysaccharide deacetylase family protein [Pontibacter silvestris]MCC9136116.1 polysaccharide deacetylase family protein [Pontibacter silvestris]
MKKELYLTIDDFPSRTSEEMLFFLKKKDIRCIIFCIGKELAKQEDLAIKALSMGFILGNHSYSHKAFSKISLREASKEIRKTHLLLEKLYNRAGVARDKKYFRFPYGDKGDGMLGQVFTRGTDPRKRLKKRKIQKSLTELGYTNIMAPGVSYGYYKNYLAKERDVHWTLDVMEWCLKRSSGMFDIKSEADVLARLFSENPFDCRGVVPEEKYGVTFTSSNEVVLMHDCEQTFSPFKTAINEMLAKGCRFAKF